MFKGLDDIPWASMEHAYGSARDVPGLIRGLVSSSAAEREASLDGMYGAVHHQGDIYECTVATVPFLLEALTHVELPGRGDLLGLLASMGRAPEPGEPPAAEQTEVDAALLERSLEEGQNDPAWQAQKELVALGGQAVKRGLPLFLSALTDPDVEVRRAAPRALLVCEGEAPRIDRTMTERFAVETDGEARRRLLWALATLGRREGAPGKQLWLASVARDDADPSLRLAALTELMRGSPGALPSDTVALASALLDRMYAAPPPPPAPRKSWTDTLLGVVRRMAAEEAEGRRAPDAGQAVHDLSRAMGGRVDARLALLAGLLRSPGREQRLDALGPVAVLMTGWRGDYAEAVGLLGQQLLGKDDRFYERVAGMLRDLFELAAPAADALLHSLQGAPREASHRGAKGHPAWVTVWPAQPPTCGPTLVALARLHDPRALPMVTWALQRREMPQDAGFLAASLGSEVRSLVPLVCQRLRDIPGEKAHDSRRHGLLAALANAGEDAAAALPQLLALAPSSGAAVRLLGKLGPVAREAVPLLRQLLDDEGREIALPAAVALWELERDARPVLPVFERFLKGDDHDQYGALDGLARLGAEASSCEARIRELLVAPDPHAWRATHGAMALWRVAGDAEVACAALRGAWQRNINTRRRIAPFLAEQGASAAPLRPEIERELGSVRRHNASDFGGSSQAVLEDEALLQSCREVLAQLPRVSTR